MYNTEKYLHKCLTSIQAQTLADLEIICVDDGSVDASCAVVEALAAKDQRIRLLRHERNRGQGAARNTGVRAARAGYIASVDSDDFIDPDMLAALHGAAIAGDFDVVASGMREVNEQGAILRTITPAARTIIIEDSHDDVFAITDPSVCTKLWKRSIYTDHNLYFHETSFYQDLGWTYPALLVSRRIKILDQAFYNYLIRTGSTTHSFGSRNIGDHIVTFEALRQALEFNGVGRQHASSFRNMIRQTLKYHAVKTLEIGGENPETLNYLRCLLAIKNAYVLPAEASEALPDAAAIIHAIEFDRPDVRDALPRDQADRLDAQLAEPAAPPTAQVPTADRGAPVPAQEPPRKALPHASRRSLTHSVGRMLEALSPSVAAKARHAWYRLNGGRFDTFATIVEQRAQAQAEHLDRRFDLLSGLLEQSVQAQSEHLDRRSDLLSGLVEQRVHELGDDLRGRLNSFEALASRLKQTSARHQDGSAAFMLSDSLTRLVARPVDADRRIAVVSVLPPLKTGVANYSLRIFQASPVPVDVFAPFDRAGPYLAATRQLPAAGGPVSIFALEALTEALTMRHYTAVVWVLGNSDHHLPVIRLMREMRHLPPLAPNLVQLHDPWLFNLARVYAEDVDSDLVSLLQAAVPSGLAGADWTAVAVGDISSLLAHPGLPVRALLADVPLRGVIVHSAAARAMLRNDRLLPDDLAVHDLFLPVLDGFTEWDAARRPRLRIGSFGVPDPAKRTDLVVAAFRMLRQEHPDATLVLAGYHAAAYARAFGLAEEPGLEIHDNPGTERYRQLMASVDVAIQLRLRNMGESSGVIPQLLSHDTPTIVSAIGSFTEYGDAVTALPPESTASELYTAIADNLSTPGRRRAARRAYAEAHGPRAFCTALLAACAARPTAD